MKVNSKEQKIVEHARRIERLNVKRDKIAGDLAEVDAELAKEGDALRALLPASAPPKPPIEDVNARTLNADERLFAGSER